MPGTGRPDGSPLQAAGRRAEPLRRPGGGWRPAGRPETCSYPVTTLTAVRADLGCFSSRVTQHSLLVSRFGDRGRRGGGGGLPLPRTRGRRRPPRRRGPARARPTPAGPRVPPARNAHATYAPATTAPAVAAVPPMKRRRLTRPPEPLAIRPLPEQSCCVSVIAVSKTHCPHGQGTSLSMFWIG